MDGAVSSIPELEVNLEKVFGTEPGDLPHVGYSRVATPSSIK